MKTYHGSCHCGAVAFEVEADLAVLTRCTCSICSKKGGLFCYVPPEQFRLLRGDDALTLYQFNTGAAKHLCLDDFDLENATYEVSVFDGRNWEAAFKAREESG